MEFLSHLWLPILLASIAVWFWSLLSCSILTIHKRDWKRLPNEDTFSGTVRPLSIPPGVYGFPHCEGPKSYKDPAFLEKWKAGPVGILNVWNPNPSMGGNMLATIVVYLVLSVLMGYSAYAAMPHAAHSKAFQVLGPMGVAAYSFSFLPNMIWYQAEGRAKVTAVIDGVIQGLITGAIFGAFWPA